MVLKAVVPLRQKQHRWNVNQSHIMQSSHEHIQKGFVFKISCKSTSYLTWYTSREALKTLEGITPRHFLMKNIYHSLCFHTISMKLSEEIKVFNQRIKIILLRVYKKNVPLSFKYTDFNTDSFYFWTQYKRVMPFTYISITTIYHCTLSQITLSCKNDAHNLEQNKYLPMAPHFCAQLSSTEFFWSLSLKRMELRSVLILKHLETKRATITERIKGYTTKKSNTRRSMTEGSRAPCTATCNWKRKSAECLSLGDKTSILASRSELLMPLKEKKALKQRNQKTKRIPNGLFAKHY